MGILNATPDSFFVGSRTPVDGGTEALVERARQMMDEGAAILDLGAVSTRPDAEPASEDEEMRRLAAALEPLRKALPEAIVSVDTVRASVARRVVRDYGVAIINDVSGTTGKEMFQLAKDFNAQIVVMHARGNPQNMQMLTDYTDLLSEIKDFLAEKISQAQAFGLSTEQIIIDPGFGFAKTREQNYQLLKHLRDFKTFGVRVLVGLSRKTFLAQKREFPPKRKAQTLAAHLVSLQNGADILRVHDVRDTRKIMNFYTELENAR